MEDGERETDTETEYLGKRKDEMISWRLERIENIYIKPSDKDGQNKRFRYGGGGGGGGGERMRRRGVERMRV